MSDPDWEQQFEDSIARERSAMIDLLDASRAVTGAFRPPGTTTEDATATFARQYEAWRAAAEAVEGLAKSKLGAD
jgi:hypothetical protein